jgi:hypothetical protein
VRERDRSGDVCLHNRHLSGGLTGDGRTETIFFAGAVVPGEDNWCVPTRWLDEHRRQVVLVCLALYAGVASLSRPLTAPAVVAVAVPAVVVLVAAGLPRSPPAPDGPPPRVRRTAAAWATLVALAAGWELVAWLHQPAYNVASYDHPTLSVLLDPVTDPWAPRFAVWCLWLYVGYRLVRR